MDKKLVFTLLIEGLIGLAVTVMVFLWTKELPWANIYPMSRSALPIIATIFVILLTLIIASIGALIRNQGNKMVNILVLCGVIIAMWLFISIL